MTFGDDIFYNRLKQEYYSENNQEIHTLLYRMICSKTAQLFPSYAYLMADLQQTAALRIMGKAIHSFLENEAFAFSPERVALRNKWLKKAVTRAGIDFLRKEQRHIRTPVHGSVDPDNPDKPFYEHIQALDLPVSSEEESGASMLSFIADHTASDGLNALLAGERVDSAFRQLFSLPRTKPEKIIVCAFVVLAGHLGLSNGAKELNNTVAHMLNGRSYSDAADALEKMLRLAGVSPSVLEPLRRRLNETDSSGTSVGDLIFDTDTRTVTHQFSSTRKQLRESIADEEDASSPTHNVVPFPSHRKDG